MKITLERNPAEQIAAGALIVPVFEGEKEPRFGAAPFVDAGEVAGKAAEFTLLHNPAGAAAARVLLAGAGKADRFDSAEMRKLVAASVRFLKKKKVLSAAVLLEGIRTGAEFASAAVEGAILGDFEPDRHKTGNDKTALASFTVVCPNGTADLDAEKVPRFRDVHARHVRQVASAHAHVERLLAQPRALALRALRIAAVAAQKHAHVQPIFLGFQVIEKTPDETVHALALFRRQVADRHVKPRVLVRLLEIRQPGAVFRLGPWLHGAARQRLGDVRDHPVHVEIDGIAEPLAARACPHRRVEAEQGRLRLHDLHPAGLALEPLVEAQLLPPGGVLEN